MVNKKTKKITLLFSILAIFGATLFFAEDSSAAVSICAGAYNGGEQINEYHSINRMMINADLSYSSGVWSSYRNSYANFRINTPGAYFRVQDNASPYGGYYNLNSTITIFHREDWAAIAENWCGSFGGNTEGGGRTVLTDGCGGLYGWGRAASQWCHSLDIIMPTCTYKKVTGWSACVNHIQRATWKYVTVPGISCVDEPLIKACNSRPVASIISPSQNAVFNRGETISFQGKVTDPENDPMILYEWREGNCETGNLLSNQLSFQKADFSPGVHTVSFRAKDNQPVGAWSNCATVSFSVQNSYPCAGSRPSSTSACPGDTQGITTSDTYWTQVENYSKCTTTRKCEYYYPAINGKIGLADGKTFCSPPTENLCKLGTPSEVTTSADGKYWIWNCLGINGGTNSSAGKALKSCAYREVNPN